jgi:hypothetical protein
MYSWTKINKNEIDSLPKNVEWAVYFILKMFMGSNGVAYPAASTVAQLAGCSVPSVKRAIRSLVEKGMLIRDGFDPKNNTARFKLPKADEGGSNLVGGISNLNRGGISNLNTPPLSNLNTNKKEKQKELINKNNQTKINPIYLLPRID